MRGKEIRRTLGFLAVTVSLVFVGVEIRQNTQAIQATAVQEATNVARQQILMFATDPEVNRISMIGSQDPSQLSPEDRQRLFWIHRSMWIGFQGIFRQWQLDVLPDEEWQFWHKIVCANIAAPGIRLQWIQEEQQLLIPAFVRVVEDCDTFDAKTPGATP